MPNKTYEQAIEKGKRIDLFVYGTLRTGEPLHEWFDGLIFRKSAAIAHGFMYSYGNNSYPVVFFNESAKNIIVGEVITVEGCDRITELINMETSVGYHCKWVPVEFENGDTQVALSFEYTSGNDTYIGESIEHGDWVKFVGSTDSEKVKTLADALVEMLCGSPDLYFAVVEEIYDEAQQDDRPITLPDAEEELEQMLGRPEFNTTIIEYIKTVEGKE